MNGKTIIQIGALLGVALFIGPGCGGCGKNLAESLTEKAMEKAINEANKQAQKDGKPGIPTGAKVDFSKDGVNIQGGGLNLNAGGEVPVPENWPKDEVPVIEGAVVKLSNMNPAMSMLNLEVGKSIQEIEAFYKKCMPEKGWTIMNDLASGNGRMLTLEKGEQVCNLALGSTPKGGSTVNIMLMKKK